MDNTLRLNIRILMWHLQITPDWRFTWTYNDYHAKLQHGLYALYTFRLFDKKDSFDICVGNE
jgi:hypothetical protein